MPPSRRGSARWSRSSTACDAARVEANVETGGACAAPVVLSGTLPLAQAVRKAPRRRPTSGGHRASPPRSGLAAARLAELSLLKSCSSARVGPYDGHIAYVGSPSCAHAHACDSLGRAGPRLRQPVPQEPCRGGAGGAPVEDLPLAASCCRGLSRSQAAGTILRSITATGPVIVPRPRVRRRWAARGEGGGLVQSRADSEVRSSPLPLDVSSGTMGS